MFRALGAVFPVVCPRRYLAFFSGDVVALRAELVSLFCVDTLRRVLLETAVPFATQRASVRGASTGAQGGTDAREGRPTFQGMQRSRRSAARSL